MLRTRNLRLLWSHFLPPPTPLPVVLCNTYLSPHLPSDHCHPPIHGTQENFLSSLQRKCQYCSPFFWGWQRKDWDQVHALCISWWERNHIASLNREYCSFCTCTKGGDSGSQTCSHGSAFVLETPFHLDGRDTPPRKEWCTLQSGMVQSVWGAVSGANSGISRLSVLSCRLQPLGTCEGLQSASKHPHARKSADSTRWL